eukprot:371409_1
MSGPADQTGAEQIEREEEQPRVDQLAGDDPEEQEGDKAGESTTAIDYAGAPGVPGKANEATQGPTEANPLGDATATHIHIRVRSPHGQEVFFRIKRTTPLSKL